MILYLNIEKQQTTNNSKGDIMTKGQTIIKKRIVEKQKAIKQLNKESSSLTNQSMEHNRFSLIALENRFNERLTEILTITPGGIK